MFEQYQPVKMGRCWGVQNFAGDLVVEPEFTEMQAHILAGVLTQDPNIDPDDLYASLVQS